MTAASITKQLSSEQRKQLQSRMDIETRVNPFAYEDNFGVWEFIKCCLGIVVLPIKLFFAISILLLMAFLCKLSISFGFDETKPMGCLRRFILLPVPFLSRCFLFVFGFFWISVKGKKVSKKEAPVLVIAPHSTFVDGFLIASQCGMTSGLGKEEAKKTPIFGLLFRAAQFIAVKRESADGKKKALDEFVRRAQTPEENWLKMLVFPEGTCTNRKALIQFKKGAFVPGVPVQPIVLRWPHKFFDPTWTSSGPSRVKLIMRLLCQFYNRVEVEFLPPYVPNEQEKEDPILFASNVRDVMAKKLGVPTTEHSYEDTFLSMAARKGRLDPNDIVNFEFKNLKDLMNLDLKEAKRLLRRFGADPKVRKTGRMDCAQFAKALKVPLSEPVYEVFDLLDTEDAGEIDFRNFLIGLTFISQNATPADGVDFLFEALDPENKGKIDLKTAQATLSKVFKKADKKMVAKLFKSVDADGTGCVDKEKFKKYVEQNPESLIIGLQITNAYKEHGRPLSVLRKSEVEERFTKQIAPAEPLDLEQGLEEVDINDE